MTTFGGKRLYEMVCKWKDLGKTKMMYIDEWKDFFGVSSKYEKKFLNLKDGCFCLLLQKLILRVIFALV